MAVDAEVNSLWQRLTAWADAETPTMTAELRAPADPAQLAQIEEATGLELPAGLRASLLIHDGEEGPLLDCIWRGGGKLLPAERILETWSDCRGLAEEPDAEEIAEDLAEGLIEVEGPVYAVAFHQRWIPFMDSNGDVTWYVDFNPAPGGKPGQIIEVYPEGCSWKVVAPSYEAFLRDYVEALESGEFDCRDEDGLPARSADLEDPPLDDLVDPESFEQIQRLNSIVERSTPAQEIEVLPPGTEVEVAGALIDSSGDTHKLSIYGGSIRIRGDLGKRPESLGMIRATIRVAEGRGKPVHTLVQWKALELD